MILIELCLLVSLNFESCYLDAWVERNQVLSFTLKIVLARFMLFKSIHRKCLLDSWCMLIVGSNAMANFNFWAILFFMIWWRWSYCYETLKVHYPEFIFPVHVCMSCSTVPLSIGQSRYFIPVAHTLRFTWSSSILRLCHCRFKYFI